MTCRHAKKPHEPVLTLNEVKGKDGVGGRWVLADPMAERPKGAQSSPAPSIFADRSDASDSCSALFCGITVLKLEPAA